MSKIIVSHEGYGCDTGCCGHIIRVDGERVGGFHFNHSWGDPFEWAKKMVSDELGPEHVADLDWENCVVVDDCDW